ncbi:MAG: hypothetical protein JW384_03001 [Nitrosomonadaceae bacterium]|nr:hypothetical protein [Nitrosomonadaceae bacterium]
MPKNNPSKFKFSPAALVVKYGLAKTEADAGKVLIIIAVLALLGAWVLWPVSGQAPMPLPSGEPLPEELI